MKTKEQFIQDVIKNSKGNHWVIFQGLITENNKTFEVELKMFNKWLQIFRVNRINHSNSAYTKTQRELKEHINTVFEYATIDKENFYKIESKV